MIILRNQYISSWSDFRRWVHQVDDQEQLKEHPEGVEDLTCLALQLLVGLGLVDLLRKTAGLRDQTGAFHPGTPLVWRVGRRWDPIIIRGLIEKYRLFISLSPFWLFLEFRREEPGGSLELLALLHRADGLLSGKRLVLMRVHGHLGVSLFCHFDQGVS